VLSQYVFIANGQTEQDAVIRVDTNLVNVFFSAVDRNNRFMTSFEQPDVTVYEDGVQQEILTFQKYTDRPLSLALLLDISGSEKLTLRDEKVAAKLFVDAVIRSEVDQVAIISFAGDPFLEQSLTNKVQDVRRAIEQVEAVSGVRGYRGKGTVLPIGARPASGSLSYTSAIWDALWITSRHLFSTLPVNMRRVVVIVTDGEDTSSRANLDEAIDIALHTDTVIYAIGVGDASIADGVNKSTLSKLALRTGGRFFLPRKNEDLTSAFTHIANELRSQYLLTYAPGNKSGEQSYRQVRIEIGDSKSRQYRPRLFYRPGYYFKQQTGKP
jgi:VWFA-related protein